MATLSERINAFRGEKGWTQEQSARKMGIPVTTFAKWERGEMVPRGLYMLTLEKFIGRKGER